MKNRLLVLTCENTVINVYIILNSVIRIDVDFFANAIELFSLNSLKKDTKYFSKKQLQ